MMSGDEIFHKVAGPKATRISAKDARQLLESNDHPRIYGLWHNQIVRFHSSEYLDKYSNPDFMWIAHTTVEDMIR